MFKNLFNNWASKTQRRELENWLEALRGCDNQEIASILAMAVNHRNDCLSEGYDLLDPSLVLQSHPGITYQTTRLVQKLQARGSQALCPGLMIWIHSLRAMTRPELKRLGREMWAELSRGQPGVQNAALGYYGLSGVMLDVTDAEHFPRGLEPFEQQLSDLETRRSPSQKAQTVKQRAEFLKEHAYAVASVQRELERQNSENKMSTTEQACRDMVRRYLAAKSQPVADSFPPPRSTEEQVKQFSRAWRQAFYEVMDPLLGSDETDPLWLAKPNQQPSIANIHFNKAPYRETIPFSTLGIEQKTLLAVKACYEKAENRLQEALRSEETQRGDTLEPTFSTFTHALDAIENGVRSQRTSSTDELLQLTAYQVIVEDLLKLSNRITLVRYFGVTPEIEIENLSQRENLTQDQNQRLFGGKYLMSPRSDPLLDFPNE